MISKYIQNHITDLTSATVPRATLPPCDNCKYQLLHRAIYWLSQEPSHLIFEINVGKRRIRHRSEFFLNDVNYNRFSIDDPSMADPPLSDIDFKNKLACLWTILKCSTVIP